MQIVSYRRQKEDMPLQDGLVPNDGDVSGNHGNRDYWVVKLSSIGATQWQEPWAGQVMIMHKVSSKQQRVAML